MKFKTTKKAINAGYYNRICIGYCNIQYMLQYKSPIAYTSRVEGWAADIYEISPNTVIITGYAPFGNIRPAYEVQERYNNQAREIVGNWDLSIDEKKSALNELLAAFVKEVTQCETAL